MQPTTRSFRGARFDPRTRAMIGRPRTDRPITTCRTPDAATAAATAATAQSPTPTVMINACHRRACCFAMSRYRVRRNTTRPAGDATSCTLPASGDDAGRLKGPPRDEGPARADAGLVADRFEVVLDARRELLDVARGTSGGKGVCHASMVPGNSRRNNIRILGLPPTH